MDRRKPYRAVLTLVVAVLAGVLVGAPATASAAPGTVPCGPTYDHILSGTPATAPRTVALTYDDGPSPRWTPQLLDILRRNRVKATFFLVGAQVEKYPELARRIAAEGHTIGNHSWDHPYFDGLPRADQARQMDRTTEVIRRVTGVTPCTFRAPYGQASGTTLALARERGMSVAGWSHSTFDFDTPISRSAQFQRAVVSRATTPRADHVDVLMHDGSNGNYRQNTVDSLQRIIDHYRSSGYYFTDPMGRWSGTRISDHYNRINGEWALGAPVSGEFRLPRDRGWATAYQGGGIYWSSSTGAHAVRGAIWDRYRGIGYETGRLGMPVTDEALSVDGRGVYQHFQGGSIYWTATTGAREVHGAIRRRWAQLGSESGLGYPTTSERATAGGTGAYQLFQRGAVYWSPSTGAHEVRGAVRRKWDSTGRETGSLGYPTGDERLLTGGRGVVQAYQRGWVYWSADSGARVVLPGAIRDRWAALGWENGPLGYPVADQRALAGGRGTAQAFQRGQVYWSSATGAQAVVDGPIRDRWASLGADGGALGLPRSGVVTTPTGSSQDFQGGTVAWTRQGGAQVLRGAVRDAWVRLQRERGALGLPLGGQHTGAAAGTTWTEFTGGVLYTTPQGPVPVLGPFATAWRAEGGDAGIGRPLAAAALAGDGGTRQAFADGVLELRPDGTVRRQGVTAPPGTAPVPPTDEVVPVPQVPDTTVEEPAAPAPAPEQSAPGEGAEESAVPAAPAGTTGPAQPAPTVEPEPTAEPVPTAGASVRPQQDQGAAVPPD